MYRLLDEEIMAEGIIWRWQEFKGLAYAEQYAKYERLVNDAMGRDGGKPRLNLGGSANRVPGRSNGANRLLAGVMLQTAQIRRNPGRQQTATVKPSPAPVLGLNRPRQHCVDGPEICGDLEQLLGAPVQGHASQRHDLMEYRA
jgi:hypothetical protein